MKTKDKILNSALELFNERGVEQVTTLLISKELGISLGNVHYHYPNRNAVIESLINRFLQDMDALSKRLIQQQPTDFFHQAIRTQFFTFKEMWKYRFLFSDRLVIARRTTYLEDLFKAMVDQRRKDFDASIEMLKENGIIRSNVNQKAIDAHFQQLVIWNNSWISFCDLFSSEDETYIFFAEQSIWTWQSLYNLPDEVIEKHVQTVKEEMGSMEEGFLP